MEQSQSFNAGRSSGPAEVGNIDALLGNNAKVILRQAEDAFRSGSYSTAMLFYKEAAEAGDLHAMFQIGQCYTYMSKSPDWGEAVKWYSVAAERGYAPAQVNLGWCYSRGLGCELNYDRMGYWYRKAATQGVSIAIYNVGCTYARGLGLPKGDEQSYSRAVELYKIAATKYHDLNSFHALGYLYANGHGVQQDWQTALKYFRRAAENGHPDSQYAIGVCFSYGHGVAKSMDEAMKWFLKAASQKHAPAAYNLACCLSKHRKHHEAVQFLKLAASAGLWPAVEALAQYGIDVRTDFFYDPNAFQNPGLPSMQWPNLPAHEQRLSVSQPSDKPTSNGSTSNSGCPFVRSDQGGS